MKIPANSTWKMELAGVIKLFYVSLFIYIVPT